MERKKIVFLLHIAATYICILAKQKRWIHHHLVAALHEFSFSHYPEDMEYRELTVIANGIAWMGIFSNF